MRFSIITTTDQGTQVNPLDIDLSLTDAILGFFVGADIMCRAFCKQGLKKNTDLVTFQLKDEDGNLYAHISNQKFTITP